MRNVAIVGTGQTPYTTAVNLTYEELVYTAARKALEDAGLNIGDIEAIVFSLAPTSLLGIDAAERWCIGAVGGINKPFMRINTGGATGGSAAQAGFFNVASGLFDTVLVVGAEKQGDTADTQLILNRIMSVRYELPFGLNAISMAAFAAVRYMKKYNVKQEHFALVAIRDRRNALNNPYAHLKGNYTMERVMSSRMLCWPMKLFDCPPRSSGACAVIMASEEKAKQITKTPVWIKGVGARSTTYWIGDQISGALFNEYGEWDAITPAAQSAYKQAGITKPHDEIQVAELYCPFSVNEVQATEALGLCEKGQSSALEEKGHWDMSGHLPVNPSGGALCSNPIAITGLARVAEAALQLTGKAEKRQVDGCRTAVTNSPGGTFQFHAVMVLSNKL